jgi:hypothetical protein
MPYKDAKRESARTQGTYDVYIDIDIDCQELLDACGLDYTTSEDDESQNEVKIILNSGEYEEMQHDCNFNYTNEQNIALFLLNAELSEYATRVQIYKPTGDKITFE